MTSTLRNAALAASALLAVSGSLATANAAPAKPAATKVNWNGQVQETANGSFALGNPEAPVKVTEFISYTCPHCAKLHQESDPVLRMTAIPKGQVSLTISNFVRNPIDVTIAMITGCGDSKTFFARHNAFMGTQETWLKKLETITPAQQQRWSQGAWPDRMRAIAGDFDFYARAEKFGMTRAKVDQCFNDEARMKQLEAQLQQAAALGIHGTPSYTINGKLDAGHTWAEMSKAIAQTLAESKAGNV